MMGGKEGVSAYREPGTTLALAGHPVGVHNEPVLLLLCWTGQPKAAQWGARGLEFPFVPPHPSPATEQCLLGLPTHGLSDS